MNTNLAGSTALMALDRLDETEYHQQQTAVRTARQGGSGGVEEGGKERGRPTKLAPAFLCCPMEVRAGVYCTWEGATTSHSKVLQCICRPADSGPVPCKLLPLN